MERPENDRSRERKREERRKKREEEVARDGKSGRVELEPFISFSLHFTVPRARAEARAGLARLYLSPKLAFWPFSTCFSISLGAAGLCVV